MLQNNMYTYSIYNVNFINNVFFYIFDIDGNLDEKCDSPGLLYRQLTKVARKVK